MPDGSMPCLYERRCQVEEEGLTGRRMVSSPGASRLAGLLLAALLPGAAAVAPMVPEARAAAQDPPVSVRASGDTLRPVPGDTYATPAVRRLVEKARTALGRRDSAIRRLDVTWRERVYLGISGERFRRERSLLRQERAARVRWSLDGQRTVRWLGTRRESPFGDTEVDFVRDFDFVDPASDSLFMGSGWGLHPLADSAALQYRYRGGDTLRIETAGRSVTLAEVLVEPREARFDLIAGSFWFDTASGVLARAAYRPARPFDLDEDEPEDAADVPGLLRPIRATVDYIVAEYGLQELRWWLPNRMAFRGRVGIAGSVAFPFQAEWSFDSYLVNPGEPLLGGGDPPPGWRRIERTWKADSVTTVELEGSDTVSVATTAGDTASADWERMVILVPPEDSLRRSPELPEPIGRGSGAFDAPELAELRERIERLDVPAAGLPGPSLAWGSGLVRYNRVEALSAGVEARVPVWPATRLEGSVRLGVADLEPNAELRLRREGYGGGASVAIYRRLQPAGDWGAPLGLGNSLNTFFLGYDDGLYYRAAGAEVVGYHRTGRLRLEGGVFAERHRPTGKQTDVSVPGIFGHDLRPNISAERGDVAGARGELRFQTGIDPGAAVLSGRVWAEWAAGDFDYTRGAASLAVATPASGTWGGALEVGAGTTGGSPPLHRRWYLGGSYSLRGFEAGALSGGAFWLARLETGRQLGTHERTFPGGGARPLRGMLFLDAGWAGPRNSFGDGGPSLGAGLGVSALDGLLRVDVARGFHGDGEWRLHLYTDGLL